MLANSPCRRRHALETPAGTKREVETLDLRRMHKKARITSTDSNQVGVPGARDVSNGQEKKKKKELCDGRDGEGQECEKDQGLHPAFLFALSSLERVVENGWRLVAWPDALFKRRVTESIRWRMEVLEEETPHQRSKAKALEQVATLRCRAAELETAHARHQVDVMRTYRERRQRLWSVADGHDYYFLHWEGSGQKEWMSKAKLPLTHYELVRPMLDDAALVDRTGAWMAHQSRSHARWSGDALAAFAHYCHEGYARVWEALEADPTGRGCRAAAALVEAMEAPWVREHSLPEGMLLFEGYGKYEGNEHADALHKAIKGGTADSQLKLPLVIERGRVTSTSWVPNAAISFLGMPSDDGSAPGIDEWRQCPEAMDDRRRQLMIRGQYAHADSMLVVYRVCQSPEGAGLRGVLRQTMEGAIYEEAEVLLQPSMRITVTRVVRLVELTQRSVGRIGEHMDPVRVDIVHADVCPIYPLLC